MTDFLPFHIPQLVKSPPFQLPEADNRYPFRAETPRIVHCREYPSGPLPLPPPSPPPSAKEIIYYSMNFE